MSIITVTTMFTKINDPIASLRRILVGMLFAGKNKGEHDE